MNYARRGHWNDWDYYTLGVECVGGWLSFLEGVVLGERGHGVESVLVEVSSDLKKSFKFRGVSGMHVDELGQDLKRLLWRGRAGEVGIEEQEGLFDAVVLADGIERRPLRQDLALLKIYIGHIGDINRFGGLLLRLVAAKRSQVKCEDLLNGFQYLHYPYKFLQKTYMNHKN